MKKIRPLFIISFMLCLSAAAKDFVLSSPDNSISATVSIGSTIKYALSYKGKPYLLPSVFSMTLSDGTILGADPVIIQEASGTVDRYITPLYGITDKIREHYKELRVGFKGRYAVVFRVYNEGFAYRIATAMDGEITINSEQNEYQFAGNYDAYFHPALSESFYRLQKISDTKVSPNYSSLPVLVKTPENISILIHESDVLNYPCMSVLSDARSANRLKGQHALYPKNAVPGGYSNFNLVVTDNEKFIARCNGRRQFPWRIIAFEENDKDILDNQLVYLLASENKLSDVSWIRPGKVAWDWWNVLNLSGVPFKTGFNTQTYKYYIDFAAANGIEYVNLDEGWSDQFNLLKITDKIDMPELLRYAKERKVGLILWCVWHTLDRQMVTALDLFEKWGIAGLKVDFMDRDDQVVVEFHEKLLLEAAKRKMLVNYHGAYHPTGMARTYPNNINVEGVRGLEYNKFDTAGTSPDHAVTIPFVRMFAGSMDYTPGAMGNYNKRDWKQVFDRPVSQGTRCQQMAMYIVYYAPLQMLADAPTAYQQEAECLRFITGVPVTWDTTVPLPGTIGKFVSVARRKGTTWWVGAMCGWEPQKLDLTLDFLDAGKIYEAEIFADGINADKMGNDYKVIRKQVKKGDQLTVEMAAGGGYALRLVLQGAGNAGNTKQLFVAPAGNDNNSGDIHSPLASFEGAKKKLRTFDKGTDVTVYFRAGTYPFSETCFLEKEDGGTASHPIIFRNYNDEKVTFTGGVTLTNASFKPVRTRDIIERLPAASRDKVLVTNLKQAGISTAGQLTQHGFGIPIQPAPLELFYNNTPLERAKWPNKGVVDIGPVIDSGSNFRKGDTSSRGAIFHFDYDRAARWKNLSNAWIAGLFSVAWSDDNLQIDYIDVGNKIMKVKQPHLYSVKSTSTDKNHLRGYYVYNLLEEIDLPGEWYLDEFTMELYVWPPASIKNATIEVSVLSAPFITLAKTANISIEGINFECARGMGILMDGATRCTVRNCNFRNLGTVAISTGAALNGGKLVSNLDGSPKREDTKFYLGSDNRIESCTIYQTGTGGIILSGGDRKQLLPANNIVSNCEFFNFSRINKTYSPAIDINGVGNIVRNCSIHDGPHEALSFLGNNHLIELNHFKNLCTETHDMGAVYTGRDPSSRGTIIRHNFFEDIRSSTPGSVCSIYLDDGASGITVDGNVFYNAASAGNYKFGAIFVHGGRDNRFSDNVFVDCEQAFGNGFWNNKKWYNFTISPLLKSRMYKDVNIQSKTYVKAYPELAWLSDTSNARPRKNTSINSVYYGSGTFSSGKGYQHLDSLVTTADPGFVSIAERNFTLRPGSTVFSRLPGFKPIPFRSIGINPAYKNSTRQ